MSPDEVYRVYGKGKPYSSRSKPYLLPLLAHMQPLLDWCDWTLVPRLVPFRFGDRGRLAVGRAADVVVFDAATVGDAATFENPHAYPRGIPHVVVNGVPVVRKGEHTGAKAGVTLTGVQSSATAK